jgi:hypothetical protein
MASSSFDDNDLLGENLLQDNPQHENPPPILFRPVEQIGQKLKQLTLASSNSSATSRLVIGIDYGTTFTG